MSEIWDWLQSNQALLIAAVAVLFVLVILQRVLGGVARLVRRRRPARLNPKLQRYAGRTEEDAEADRRAAMQILATSSTGAVPGYEIVRQVDAVFVEGLRSQGEAITALKAVAAARGANAIINLTHTHTAAGRCTAQGDAVVIRPTTAAEDAMRIRPTAPSPRDLGNRRLPPS